MFNFTIDGDKNFVVEPSSHATDRIKKENFNKFHIYGCLIYMIDKITCMEIGEEFIVVDGNGNFCVVAFKKDENTIGIVTVTLNSAVFVKKGLNLFCLPSILE